MSSLAIVLLVLFAGPAFPQTADTEAPPSIIHRGDGAFVAPPAEPETPAAAPDAPRLDIVFDGAPVGVVVQTLLADFANASVVIDPRVQGEITIRSQGQLTAAELPVFLRTSVAALGLELIAQAPNAYLLRPAENQAENRGAELYRPGLNSRAGLVIYGLRHVSAQEMARLIQPLARQGVTITAERGRELLFLVGQPDQIQSIARTIELLDVDWLASISLGIVPLEYAEPEPLIVELRALFGGADGSIGTMLEFVPLPARRAVLVLAKRPERLDQARTWIAQLDRPLTRGGRIRFLPLENAQAARVVETLNPIFSESEGGARISADAARNALIVQSDPATYQEIETLVRALDAPVDQVMIEVTIAEVNLNNDFRFGIQWSFDLRDGGRVSLSEGGSGQPIQRFPGFSYGFVGNYVQASLNALSSRTNVEVISSPVVVTLDNQEAVLQVGDEVPIVTQTAANVTTPDATVVNTVQYRETGILLRVTPRIGRGGIVTLEVTQEASEVAATTTSGIDSPTIQQRRFASTVSIADGETVALGGLIRATRTRGRAGIPLLSDIPMLGAVFRNDTTAVRRTELLVFLTPRILRSPTEAIAAREDLSLRLERIRASRFIQRRLETD